MIESLEVDALASRLLDRSSVKRRSAAKKLRKLGDPRACGALLTALEAEELLEDDIAHLGCSEEMIQALRRFVTILLDFVATTPPSVSHEEAIAAKGWPDVRSSAGDFVESAHSWHQQNRGEVREKPWHALVR